MSDALQGIDYEEAQRRLQAALAQRAGLQPAAPPDAGAVATPLPAAAPAPAAPLSPGIDPAVLQQLKAAQDADWDKTNRNQMLEGAREILSASGNVPYQPRATDSTVNQKALHDYLTTQMQMQHGAIDARLKEAQAKQAEAHAKFWEGGGRPTANKITVTDGNRADVIRILSRVDPKTDYGSMSNAGLEMAYAAKAQMAGAGSRETQLDLATRKDARAEQRSKESTEKHGTDLIGKLKKDLDPYQGRAGVFGDYGKQKYQAEKLLALTANGYDLDNRQLNEFAIGLNKLLSGSSAPAQKQVEHLIPRTIWTNAASLKEYISNNPQGVSAQEFVKRMEETIKREKDIAEKNIRDTQIARLPAHRQAFKSRPDEARAVLKGWGIDPSAFGDDLLPAPPKTEVADPLGIR